MRQFEVVDGSKRIVVSGRSVPELLLSGDNIVVTAALRSLLGSGCVVSFLEVFFFWFRAKQENSRACFWGQNFCTDFLIVLFSS